MKPSIIDARGGHAFGRGFAASVGGILAALTFSAAVMADPRDYRDPNYDYVVAGDPALPRAVADDRFDPDDGRYDTLFVSRWGPVTSAETIVFHRREASIDPRVRGVLRGAVYLERLSAQSSSAGLAAHGRCQLTLHDV